MHPWKATWHLQQRPRGQEEFSNMRPHVRTECAPGAFRTLCFRLPSSPMWAERASEYGLPTGLVSLINHPTPSNGFTPTLSTQSPRI